MPPLASIPKRFPDFEIPPGALVIEPASSSGDGMRIDLFVPARTVDDVQRFFLKQVKSGGHEVVWTDNEGFEAEVYFRFKDKRIGLVRALITCNDGTIASFEVFDP